MAQIGSEDVFRRMVDLRRYFHRYPELSFEEVDTARRVMDELDRLGIPHEYGGKGGGVVGCRGAWLGDRGASNAEQF